MPQVLLLSASTGAVEPARMDAASLRVGRRAFKLHRTVGALSVYELSAAGAEPFPFAVPGAPHVLCYGDAVVLAAADGTDLLALPPPPGGGLVLPAQLKPLRAPNSKRSSALVARAVQALLKKRGGAVTKFGDEVACDGGAGGVGAGDDAMELVAGAGAGSAAAGGGEAEEEEEEEEEEHDEAEEEEEEAEEEEEEEEEPEEEEEAVAEEDLEEEDD